MSTVLDKASGWDRLAPRYLSEVISPFSPEVDFRLRSDLRGTLRQWHRDGSARERAVVDFGCGTGEALELISGNVGVAAGIDFSAAMLDQSQERLDRTGRRVERFSGHDGLHRLQRGIAERRDGNQTAFRSILLKADILHLPPLYNSCDLAVAVNSTAPESTGEAFEMVHQIVSCIKPGGLFFAVFPSLDTMDYLIELSQRHHVHPPALGTIDAQRIYVHPNGERQKFFMPNEILQLAKESHLETWRLEKVEYPWRMTSRFGWGCFPDSPRLWDWYLVAGKPR